MNKLVTTFAVAFATLSIDAHANDLVGQDVYGPYVKTWNDNLHHERGIHQARHLTAAGLAWHDELINAGCTEGQADQLLRVAYTNGNKIPSPVDSEPDDDRLTPEQHALGTLNDYVINSPIVGVFDKSFAHEIVAMMLSKDTEALADTVTTGKGILLTEGMKVHLVGNDIFGGYRKVRSLGSSQEVWIPKEFLR